MKGKNLLINLTGFLINTLSTAMIVYSKNPWWLAGVAISAWMFSVTAKQADKK